jgi:hypothetical protein
MMTEQKEYVQDLDGLHISHQGEINENNMVMSLCSTFFRPTALPNSAHIHSCPRCEQHMSQQKVSDELSGT